VPARRLLLWVPGCGALAAGGLLTTARLVDGDAEVAIRLVSYTPFGMALYAAALLLLLASVRGAARRATALAASLSLLAAAGLVWHAWWFAPLVTGENPPAAAGAPTLRVMTASLYDGRADGVALVRELAELDVDLLVAEEVTSPILEAMDRAGLEELLPHRAGEAAEGSHGTMVFSTEPLDEPVPLDTTWDAWRVARGDLVLLAVHPVAPHEPAGWRRDHAAILAAARAGDVDLVVGDLNATVDHAPMRRLADAGYRSVTELANEGWQPTAPAHASFLGVPLPSLAQIDHVLVSPRLAALSSWPVDVPGSDHRGLVAEVAVK
jgi:endonuclease/exonuclease/phosphatase family metal-dependent hydrolase